MTAIMLPLTPLTLHLQQLDDLRLPDHAALLNHWILNTAVTFNPVPKTADDILAMIAAKAADGHAFLVAEVAGTVVGQASRISSLSDKSSTEGPILRFSLR